MEKLTHGRIAEPDRFEEFKAAIVEKAYARNELHADDGAPLASAPHHGSSILRGLGTGLARRVTDLEPDPASLTVACEHQQPLPPQTPAAFGGENFCPKK